ncbi:MAG: hypothetical protein AAB225_19220 [Acidobacteriota bacterium]
MPERLLAEIDTRRRLPTPFLAWTPDGKFVIAPGTDAGGDETRALFLYPVETGAKQRLTSPPADTRGDTSPALSPDGRTLAFVRCRSYTVHDLCLLPLSDAFQGAGEPRKVFAEPQSNIAGVAWTRDGKELIYSSGQLGRQALWRVSPAGPPAPKRLPFAGEGALHPVLSPAGGRLAYLLYSEDTNLWRIQESGNQWRVSSALPGSSSRFEGFPDFSPDGERIALMSDRSGTLEIWTCRKDGSNWVQLTRFGKGLTGFPRWSPDSKRIVFDSRAEGQSDIYVVNADGSGLRRLTKDPSYAALPSWSRDGKSVYFCSLRSGQYQTWRMPAEGGEAIQVTRNGGVGGVESHDGRRLYFANRRFDSGVWRVQLPSGEETEVIAAVSWRGFAVTGEGIYFTPPADEQGKHSVQFLDLATGKTRVIAALPKSGPFFYGLAVSADGRTILWAQTDQISGDLMLVEKFR